MGISKPATISGRVSLRVRRMAEVAAQGRGVTLSRFVADAVEHEARREFLADTEQPGERTAAQPGSIK